MYYCELIGVDGSHLWSQPDDRDVHDIFKVQESIAVGNKRLYAGHWRLPRLASKISEHRVLQRSPARSLFDSQQTKQDTARGIAAIEEALKLDPEYAAAWAELALGYINYLNNGWIPPKEAYTAARKAVDRALAIDPNLASAHDVLSILEWNYNHDVVASEAEFRRARELAPDPASDADNAATLAAIAGLLR